MIFAPLQLLHTLTGKEYLTPEQLEEETVDDWVFIKYYVHYGGCHAFVFLFGVELSRLHGSRVAALKASKRCSQGTSVGMRVGLALNGAKVAPLQLYVKQVLQTC